MLLRLLSFCGLAQNVVEAITESQRFSTISGNANSSILTVATMGGGGGCWLLIGGYGISCKS